MSNGNETETFETIVLPNNNHVATEYAIMEQFTFEDKNYMLLSKVEDDVIKDDEASLVRYHYEDCNEEEIVVELIDDDAEYQRAVEAYYKYAEEKNA